MTTTQTRPSRSPETASDQRREQPWMIVATREVLVKVTDKSFIVSTLVSVLMMVGLMAFLYFIAGRAQETKVAVTTVQAQQVVAAIGPTLASQGQKDTATSVVVPDRAAALAALKDERVDAFLEQGPDGFTRTFQKEPSAKLTSYVGDAVRTTVLAANAAKAGVSPAQLQQGSAFKTALVEGDAERAGVAYAVSLVFAVLFFMSALVFGLQIATSVVQEKQSRIVEILASSMPLRQLLAGKVLGNSVMALAQMVLYAGVGLIGLAFTPYKIFVPGLSGAVGWFVTFFLAGFLALACVWAAAGSLASCNEDLQQTTMPLTLGLTVVYMAGFMAQGVWKVVLSFVPVVSSVLMPVRLFEGTASWWEAAIALAINLAFAAVTVIVGERIYRASLLQLRGRLGIRDALRLDPL